MMMLTAIYYNTHFILGWEIPPALYWFMMFSLSILAMGIVKMARIQHPSDFLKLFRIGKNAFISVHFPFKRRELNRQKIRTDRSPVPRRASFGRKDSMNLAEVGEVLFPGQARYVEALAQAYSEDYGDESLFSFCCDQELEDILTEAAEQAGQLPERITLPLEFLPLVTGQLQGDETEQDNGKNPEAPQTVVAFALEDSPEFDPNSLYESIAGGTMEDSGSPGIGMELEFLPFAVEDFPDESLQAGDVAEEASANSEESDAVNIKGFSIFDSLVGKCDSENKIILLPELLAIGGERELALLDFLATNESGRLSKLAKQLGNELREQLTLDGTLPAEQAGSEPHRPESEEQMQSEIVAAEKRSLEYCFLREDLD